MLNYEIFFIKHPEPMAIYDIETLKFLDVNEAAVAIYGYSKEELLCLTIADIRPQEDQPGLRSHLATAKPGAHDIGIWRHKLKSGKIIFAQVRTQDMTYDGRSARIISARDVTSLVEGELDKSTSLRLALDISQRLTETLEGLSDGFFTLDNHLAFTFVNREAEYIFKVSRTEILGKRLADAFPGVTGGFEAQYQHSLKTGEVVRFTEYFPPFDQWFEVYAHPTSGGLAVYFRDVTERQKKFDQLRLLEKAIAHVNDILIITTADSIDEPCGPLVVFANDAFTAHTGYSREEILNRTPRMLQGPDTERDRLDIIRKAIEDKQPCRTELINYTKSGEEIHLDMEIIPFADDSGGFTHWVSVQRDITHQKRAEEAQKLSDARFATITRAVNDVVREWDLATNELWWSEAMQSQFGFSQHQIESGFDWWKDHIHPEDQSRVQTKIEATLEGRSNRWEDEYRFARADGSYASVVDRGYIMRDPDGAGKRMISTMMDVTERRDMEIRLNHFQKLEALGQFTGGIAHDFNNLLTVIMGNAEILAENLPTDTDLHALASLSLAAAERGAELTNRLLAFGRRQPLQSKLVDVNEQIQEMVPLLKRALSENISLEILAQSEHCYSVIDAGQFENALLNLVINARDAMPDGGNLTIRTDTIWLDKDFDDTSDGHEGNFVMVSVQDNGSGMDSTTVSRAFEPFFTTKDVGEGTGLGLSMVHGFVRQSLGRVQLVATPKVGTKVIMYFPMVSSEEGIVPIKELNPCKQRGNEKILIVEDDDMVRTHVTSHLSKLGYTVIGANSGSSAMAVLQREDDIQLVFTDVVMPGEINGGKLAEKARALRPNVKVLITSGYIKHAAVTDAIEGREVSVLLKPYRLADLAQKIRSIFE